MLNSFFVKLCLWLLYPEGVVERLGGSLAEVELVGRLLAAALDLHAVGPLLRSALLTRFLLCFGGLRRDEMTTGFYITSPRCKTIQQRVEKILD